MISRVVRIAAMCVTAFFAVFAVAALLEAPDSERAKIYLAIAAGGIAVAWVTNFTQSPKR